MRGSGSMIHLFLCSFIGGATAISASAGGVIDVKDCDFSRLFSTAIFVGSMSAVTCASSSIADCGTGISGDACENVAIERVQVQNCSVGE